MVGPVARAAALQLGRRRWRGRLPPGPVVPPWLGLAAGIGGLSGLNLAFTSEVWPNTPLAQIVWGTIALLSGAFTWGQALLVLWRWPAAYTRPARVWLFWVAAMVVGSSLLGSLLVLTAVIMVI